VSQHGADSHAWDPLAHLAVTTTAHGQAARLVDAIAHRHGTGRWLATGGGGYDAYRVVPRTWALTWMAGAHREVPSATPLAWRERWAAEGARYGQSPLPETFEDLPNAGFAVTASQEAAEQRADATAALLRSVVTPRLVERATDLGWYDPMAASPNGMPAVPDHAGGTPTILPSVDAETWAKLSLKPWVIAPADPTAAHGLVAAALRSQDAAVVTAAVQGPAVVGLAISGPLDPRDQARDLLAVGVAPTHRRQGLATRLMQQHAPGSSFAAVSIGERDAIDPLPVDVRRRIGRSLLERAGYAIRPAEDDIRAIDPGAFIGERR